MLMGRRGQYIQFIEATAKADVELECDAGVVRVAVNPSAQLSLNCVCENLRCLIGSLISWVGPRPEATLAPPAFAGAPEVPSK